MEILDRVLCGLLAGFISTVPMTFVMVLLFYYLPKYERYTLPPLHVTKIFTKKMTGKAYIDPARHRILTFVNHFGYGALAGAFFAILEGYVHDYLVIKGLIFGLIIWGFSYVFLMPSIGLFPLSDRRPPGFNLIMMSAHMVWGLFLVLCYLFFMNEVHFLK